MTHPPVAPVPELRVPLGGREPRGVAVVVRGHKLLVMGRVLDGYAYAVLPGGGIEPGESAEEAAVRELAEECTLTGTAVRLLFEGRHGGREASYVLVDAPEGEPVLGGPEAAAQSPSDHYQPMWVTAPELPLLPLLPEGLADLVVEAVWPLRAAVAGPDQWPVVEQLWQLYQHDLSEFRHSAPGRDGRFAPARLTSYADGERGDRVTYLAWLGEVPCGFAMVRGVAGGARVMGEFFVTRSARGRGTAASFAGDVLRRHPGRWEIPFQEENPRAAAFWRRIAGDLLVDVAEQPLEVPGKPHLPPDVWLSGNLPS